MNGMPTAPALTDNPLGWLVVAVGAVATAWAIVASVYWAIRPGELDPLHPKYTILRDDR